MSRLNRPDRYYLYIDGALDASASGAFAEALVRRRYMVMRARHTHADFLIVVIRSDGTYEEIL